MQALTFRLNGDIYTRISKAKARRLFEQSKVVYLQPAKLAICETVYPCPISQEPPEGYVDTGIFGSQFEERIAWFEWYNCNYETGYYPAFYTRHPEPPTG